MRPTAIEIIRGIQAALAGHVLPELTSRYAQAQVMYSMMLLEMLTREWEESAHLLSEDNRALRGVLARGAELIDALPSPDAEARALAKELRAAAEAPPEPSLRMTDLREANERLRSAVTRLGEACDRAHDDERLRALLPLWDEVIAHLREEVGRRGAPVPGR